MMMDYESEKKHAAKEALSYVKDNMVIGIGSGSTVSHFIAYLGERVKEGLHIIGVPTSKETERLCLLHGIPLITTQIPAYIDFTVDGADEFDSYLRLIKGGGGYLLKEKLVASLSKRTVIITDSRKRVDVLGRTYALPIEVIPVMWNQVAQRVNQMGGEASLRTDGEPQRPYVSENGHYIIDCKFPFIDQPERLAHVLKQIHGVMEHGLFIGVADEVIMGEKNQVRHFSSVAGCAQSKVIVPEKQVEVINAIWENVTQVAKTGQVPVVEIDIDMTAFTPRSRTIQALQAAGKEYGILEFLHPEKHFDLLPGYTREAWNMFISRFMLPEKYPHLRWLGYKDGVGEEASVYSAFHLAFWNTEWLEEDTLTTGLVSFVEEIQQRGGKTVFLSGRWKEEQFKKTKNVLIRGGLEQPLLLIGNPDHDSETPLSDAEIKAFRQKEIREKYGLPCVIIDDRLENRRAVCDANKGMDLISVGIALDGFTYDQEITGITHKISTFEYRNKDTL